MRTASAKKLRRRANRSRRLAVVAALPTGAAIRAVIALAHPVRSTPGCSVVSARETE